jgi:hypothetical protein
MAIEDYFKGSSEAYGQLAGSLLAGNRKADKKRAKRALIASTVMGTFGALQQKQKQTIIDNSNDVKEKYQDIFDNNEEIYNSKVNARADFLKFKENEDAWIENKAKELFNQDLDLQAQLGTNPYSAINKQNLTEESYDLAQKRLDVKRKEARTYIESQAVNPAVTTLTFTKFNAPAKVEYQAAMDAVKDDPYKQGLIKSAYNKYFGDGEDTKADLLDSLEKAKAARTAQENYIPYSETVKGIDAARQQKIANGKRAGLLGTGLEEDLFVTKEEVLEKTNKAVLKNIENAQFKDIKIGSDEYKKLQEDIVYAYRKGLSPSKIKELDELQENQLEDFTKVFSRVETMSKRSPNSDVTDFLSMKDRDIYDTGMGITRDDYNLLEEAQDATNRTTITAQINSIIGRGDKDSELLGMIDGQFGTGVDATGQSSIFVTNVIKAKTVLQKKYDMEETEAFELAYNMQIEGINEEQGGSQEEPNTRGWLGRKLKVDKTTHSVEYVNPDVEELEILPETMKDYADNLNENMYMQKRKYKDEDGNSKTFAPDVVGKQFVVGAEDYTITFEVAQDKKWTPSIIFNKG